MLAMVFSLPLVFGLVVWRSYRTADARAARGEDVSTPGTLRWDDAGVVAGRR